MCAGAIYYLSCLSATSFPLAYRAYRAYLLAQQTRRPLVQNRQSYVPRPIESRWGAHTLLRPDVQHHCHSNRHSKLACMLKCIQLVQKRLGKSSNFIFAICAMCPSPSAHLIGATISMHHQPTPRVSFCCCCCFSPKPTDCNHVSFASNARNKKKTKQQKTKTSAAQRPGIAHTKTSNLVTFLKWFCGVHRAPLPDQMCSIF